MPARLLRGPRRRPRRRRGGDQEGVPRGSPASCTPTSTATTPRPRRSSRRRPRPTRSSPTPSGGAPTTPSATRACAPAAGRRTRRAGSRTSSRRSSARRRLAVRRPVRRRRRAGPGRRAATSASAVEITLAEVARPASSARSRFEAVVRLRALPRQRRRAGDADPHLRDLRRRRPGAAGAPHARSARWSRRRRLPDLRRRRQDRRAAVRALRRRRARARASAPGRSRSRPGSSTASGSGSAAPATPGEPGGRAGDLYVAGRGRRRRALRAPRATTWSRSLEVPATLAMLGGKLDGRRRSTASARSKLAAGAQHGHTERLKGRGPAVAAQRPARRAVRARRRRRSPTQALAQPARACAQAPARVARDRRDRDPARGPLPARARRAGARRAARAGARAGSRRSAGDELRSSTRSTGRRASCPSCPSSRPPPATGWSRSARPRSPTTGPTAGATSTSRSSVGGGRIVVRPSWEERAPATRREPRCDMRRSTPGQAFGTGAHATTQHVPRAAARARRRGRGAGPLADLGHRLRGARDRRREARLRARCSAATREAAAIEAAARERRGQRRRARARAAQPARAAPPPPAPTVVANLTAPLLRERRRAARASRREALVCSGLLASEVERGRARRSRAAGLEAAERARARATGRRCCAAARDSGAAAG